MTTESSEQSGAVIEAKHDETVTEPRALLNGPHEPEYCHPREKQLICKVDWRLLPILGALYAIALVDRVNISNAYVAGMGKDLHLAVGSRYTIALVVFFIPCFLFELPSNIVLRRVGTAYWLAFLAFAWGIVMLGQGFVKNYQALTVCRALVSFFESGFFPGCVYLVSCWYVRYEVQKRLATFYLFSVLFSGFSHILAHGLMQMEGVGDLRGWRWIFIIEGLLTQVTAIAAWFLIIDFPDRATEKSVVDRGGFLSPSEAALIQKRIEVDRGDSVPDSLTLAKTLRHLCDLKMWAFAFFYMSSTMPAYAFAYFTPAIAKGMGYSPGISNLLSARPVVAAAPSALFFAYLSDKYRLRAPFIALQSIICLVGLMLTAYTYRNSTHYLGIFLGVMGCQGNIPAVLAYQSNNIRLQSKRAVGTALEIGFGSLGGIIASTAFRAQDAPGYLPGLWVTAALQLGVLFGLAIMSCWFCGINRGVDRGTEMAGGLVGFKYTL